MPTKLGLRWHAMVPGSAPPAQDAARCLRPQVPNASSLLPKSRATTRISGIVCAGKLAVSPYALADAMPGTQPPSRDASFYSTHVFSTGAIQLPAIPAYRIFLAICLHAPYAMPGTDAANGATSLQSANPSLRSARYSPRVSRPTPHSLILLIFPRSNISFPPFPFL
eukprot:1013423-Rhodomonas_salina.2